QRAATMAGSATCTEFIDRPAARLLDLSGIRPGGTGSDRPSGQSVAAGPFSFRGCRKPAGGQAVGDSLPVATSDLSENRYTFRSDELRPHRPTQRIEQVVRAALTAACVVIAVEEGTLFGEYEARAASCRLQLYCGQ